MPTIRWRPNGSTMLLPKVKQNSTAPSCFADIQLSLPHRTAVPSNPQGRYYLFLSCWQAMQGFREQRNTYFAVLLCSAPTTSCLEKWHTHPHTKSTRTNGITLLDFFQLQHQEPLLHRSCTLLAKNVCGESAVQQQLAAKLLTAVQGANTFIFKEYMC